MGDFNKILYSHEKQGGNLRDERCMEGFRFALDDCDLLDVGYEGKWFMWERGKLTHNNSRERLDKGESYREQ